MRGFKGLKLKKKEKKYVDLHLKKDEETQVFRMETGSLLKMAKAVKKLTGLLRKHWQLTGCTGNDAEKVRMFQKVAEGYVPTTGEALEFGGLPNIPKKMKKLTDKAFRKEEGSHETDQKSEAKKQ